MNKKVILFSNTFWYLNNFRKSSISQLLKQGYEVHCISQNDNSAILLEDLGCKIHSIELSRKGINPYNEIKTLLQVIRVFKTINARIAFNFTIKPNIYGNIACIFMDTKSICHVTGFGTVSLSKKLTLRSFFYIYCSLLNLADKIYFQNKTDRAYFLKKKFISPEKIFLIPGSGVNLNHFKYNNKKSYDDTENFIFLYIGRIIKDKGINELFMAFDMIVEQFPKAKLEILGDIDPGNLSSFSLKELENFKAKDYATFHGFITDINSYLMHSSCVVLPSYSEGLPRSLLEGGATGNILIGSKVSGCIEIIKDGVNGFLCNPGDHLSLFNSIKRVLLLSQNDFNRMSVNSRKVVESKFDEKIVIDELLSNLL